MYRNLLIKKQTNNKNLRFKYPTHNYPLNCPHQYDVVDVTPYGDGYIQLLLLFYEYNPMLYSIKSNVDNMLKKILPLLFPNQRFSLSSSTYVSN